MRHRLTGKIFSRKVAPRTLMLRGLAASVILHERVTTTVAKAQAVRPMVERCVTVGKAPTLAARRMLLQRLAHPRAVAKTVEVLGPRYRERAGGYTRMTKVGRRMGDGAEMAVIEFV